MKRLLFFICFVFAFVQTSKANPVKQKAKSEISPMQIAILKQNKLVFASFAFQKCTDHYAGYVVKYKKERFLFPKNGGKPCKIPIPTRTRNKDNI